MTAPHKLLRYAIMTLDEAHHPVRRLHPPGDEEEVRGAAAEDREVPLRVGEPRRVVRLEVGLPWEQLVWLDVLANDGAERDSEGAVCLCAAEAEDGGAARCERRKGGGWMCQ